METALIGMNFKLNIGLTGGYKNSSQKIRVMTEAWVADNIFCPVCGSPHVSHLSNNLPVADIVCPHCGENFELKSKSSTISNKITDGAYSTMIERINSISNPELFIMQYSKNLEVVNLTLIPKFFFVPSIIEKRKPLSENARRAGWTGCNILLSKVPEQAKITIIKNQICADVDLVVGQYAKLRQLQTNNISGRGWLMDILNCVNSIKSSDFFLDDIYGFAGQLKLKHPDNQHIQAKIRQQLQLLRDKGFIEFLGNGHYRKI